MNRNHFIVLLAGRRKFTLPYAIDFSTKSDGALPAPLIGATWAISSGKAINMPIETPVALVDGGLENWTTPTNLTSWTESIAGTSTINREATVIHGGTYAARFDIDASNSAASIEQSLTGLFSVGNWVIMRAYAQCSGTGKRSQVKFVNQFPEIFSHFMTNGSYSQIQSTTRIINLAGISLLLANIDATSLSIYLDDISLNKLTTGTLMAGMETGKSDVTAKAKWSIQQGTQAGVILNIDSLSNPQNFVMLIHSDDNLDNMHLIKCVGGVYSNVAANQSSPYVADADVELRKVGTTYQMYYNGVKVGTDQTISDAGIINNTIHGVFSTFSGNLLSRFFLSDTAKPVINLLMVGDSKTALFGVIPTRFQNDNYDYLETPTRIATAGWTTQNMKDYIDTGLAAATGTPDYVAINLGANDVAVGTLPNETTWKSNTAYIIDAILAKWPLVKIYLMDTWAKTMGAEHATLKTWRAAVISGYDSRVYHGPDEAIFLENGDGGATYMLDTKHPNDAGYDLTASEWRIKFGY